jgi:hypothetical protein
MVQSLEHFMCRTVTLAGSTFAASEKKIRNSRSTSTRLLLEAHVAGTGSGTSNKMVAVKKPSTPVKHVHGGMNRSIVRATVTRGSFSIRQRHIPEPQHPQ